MIVSHWNSLSQDVTAKEKKKKKRKEKKRKEKGE